MNGFKLATLAVVGVLAIGCGEDKARDESEAGTISPVTPEVVDDSKPDLSQTFEVGEDRSQNEGADLPGFEDDVRGASQTPPGYVDVAQEGQPVPPEKERAELDEPN